MAPPNEPRAVGEQLMQLDQAITLTLQEIDENFSQAHQVITSRILPAIREYEVACSHTWAGARFWKQFFEASAQVSLSQQPLEEVEESVRDDTPVYAPPPGDTSEGQDSQHWQSPPRLSYSMYAPQDSDSSSPVDQSRALETPFERLKRDVEESRTEATDVSTIAQDPSVALHPVPTSSSPVRVRSATTPGRSRRSSVRPRVSIVGSGAVNPFSTEESTRTWNGIADLRTTPLRGTPLRHEFTEPLSPSTRTHAPVPRATPAVADDTTLATPARRKSVVGTPLIKRTPSGRRDSMPTPPTITKVHRPTSDEGNTLPGLFGSMLDLVCTCTNTGPRLGHGIGRLRAQGERHTQRLDR